MDSDETRSGFSAVPLDIPVSAPTLQDQLRDCAKSTLSIADPHWIDTAKRLMLWAADSLDAAEDALRDNYDRMEVMGANARGNSAAEGSPVERSGT